MKWGRRKASAPSWDKPRKTIHVNVVAVPVKSNKKLDAAVERIAKSSMTEAQKIHATNQLMGAHFADVAAQKVKKKKPALRKDQAALVAGLLAAGTVTALKYGVLKQARRYADQAIRDRGYSGPL